MQTPKAGLLPNIVNAAVFFAVIFFHTSEIADISIKTATPFILLPLITAYSIFAPFGYSLAAGLISGAFIDSVSSRAYCFNTIMLMLIATFVCMASSYLFNKNIKSAAVLALITSGAYFIFLWLFFYSGTGSMEDSVGFLLKYAFPSAVYSAVFIFPFYYLCRFLADEG
jgi:cell shape-determining protein MreD